MAEKSPKILPNDTFRHFGILILMIDGSLDLSKSEPGIRTDM